MDDLVRQPTAEECSAQAEIRVDGRVVGHACWYPSTGGYVGKAVIVPDRSCVNVYVWHDGEFPFDGKCQECRQPREPVVLHHCEGQQFVQFGQLVSKVMGEVGG